MVQRLGETRQVRVAETAFLRAVENLDDPELSRQRVGHRAGPVRRVVVHDQDPVASGSEPLELGRGRTDDPLDRRRLVVSGDHYPDCLVHGGESVTSELM
jgi:hypothetical protein